MITQFKTLFEVGIAHPYYRETCEDVTFIIPEGTAQWLRNGKLVAKELEGRLHVLFEADETGPALKPISGQTLRIGLRLLNPSFSNFTKVDATFASSKLLYGNAVVPAALDAPIQVQLVGHIFSHTLTDGARPVTLTLRDKAGLELRTDEITAAVNRPAISYDLTGLPPGVYTVDEDYPAGLTRNPYYSEAELLQAGVFGIIEVKIDGNFYGAPPAFQIDFEPREETLKYYVVARNYADADVNQLSVLDTGFGDDGRPQINFTKVPSSAFTAAEIPPALLTNSTGKVVLFKSQAVVARAEKGRKKIQLKKNGDVLIAHLPQPRPERTTADLVIPVSKP
jgi:hypothetical protein